METMPKSYRFDAYHVLPDSLQMQKDFLYIVASLHARSSESIAAEIVRIAKVNGILPVEVTGFQDYPGRGLGGLVTLPNEQKPRAVLIGSRDFMAQCGLQIPAILEATTRLWEKESDTHILLAGWDSSVRGIIKLKK